MPKGHMLFTREHVRNMSDVEKDLMRRYINLGKRLDITFRESYGWQWWDYYLDHPDFSKELPESTEYYLTINNNFRGKSCLPYIASLHVMEEGQKARLQKAYAGYYSHKEDSERGI